MSTLDLIVTIMSPSTITTYLPVDAIYFLSLTTLLRKFNVFYVDYSNTEYHFAFDKEFDTDYLGFPYDYNSIMHYDSYAFSNNGQPTIVAKQSGITLTHTSVKNGISDIDVGEIRKRYNCV